MLNFGRQWNAMSTTTKIALVGAFIGLVGIALVLIDKL